MLLRFEVLCVNACTNCSTASSADFTVEREFLAKLVFLKFLHAKTRHGHGMKYPLARLWCFGAPMLLHVACCVFVFVVLSVRASMSRRTVRQASCSTLQVVPAHIRLDWTVFLTAGFATYFCACASEGLVAAGSIHLTATGWARSDGYV